MATAKDQTLRVMFNQRMGLPTNESIPFRWKDNTLTADYRELQAGKAYFDKPLVLTTNDGSSREPATDNGSTATASGAVIIAPPAAQEVPAGESSFAQNETVLSGTGATAVPVPVPAAAASFSAGMLQASTQPDNAIEQTLRQFLQSNGGQASGT